GGAPPGPRPPRRQRGVVVALSRWSLTGRLRGRPGRPRDPLTGGTVSTTASSSIGAWVLAADSPTAKGMPRRSTSRWYLDPGLPRSVGFGPVRQPPAWHARSPSPGWGATSRAGHRGRAGPTAPGAGAARRRRVASRAGAASR